MNRPVHRTHRAHSSASRQRVNTCIKDRFTKISHFLNPTPDSDLSVALQPANYLYGCFIFTFSLYDAQTNKSSRPGAQNTLPDFSFFFYCIFINVERLKLYREQRAPLLYREVHEYSLVMCVRSVDQNLEMVRRCLWKWKRTQSSSCFIKTRDLHSFSAAEAATDSGIKNEKEIQMCALNQIGSRFHPALNTDKTPGRISRSDGDGVDIITVSVGKQTVC